MTAGFATGVSLLSPGRFIGASLSRWMASVFGGVLFIIVLGVGYNLRQLSAEESIALSNYRHQRDFTHQRIKLAKLQKQIEIDIAEIQRTLLESLIALAQEGRAAEVSSAEQLKGKLDSDIDLAKRESAKFDNEQLVSALATMEREAAEFWRLGMAMTARYLFRTANSGILLEFNEKADKLRSILQAADSAIENVATTEQQDAEHENRRSDWLRANAFNSNLYMMLFAGLACFVGIAAVWIWVTTPLKEITVALRKLAEGETKQIVEGTTRADEIGELARAYEEFRKIILERMAAYRIIKEQQAVVLLKQRQTEVLTKRFDAALSNMPLGLLMIDARQRLLVANTQSANILGLPSEALTLGKQIREVPLALEAAGSLDKAAVDEVRHAFQRFVTRQQKDRHLLKLTDGRALEFLYHPMSDGGGLFLVDDISERHRAQLAVHQLAWFDPLTELPNRRFLLDAIALALSPSDSIFEPFALLFIDLDHFKEVNDAQGHGAGDTLLRQVAQRLAAVVQQNDVVARLGGDEFVILQKGTWGHNEAEALAIRIIEVLQEPFDVGGREVITGATVGIALTNSKGKATDTLLREADIALYRAKAGGRGTWRMFEPQMCAEVFARRRLEHDLRIAVRDGGFEVHYQPIMSASSGKVSAFEALLRWRHAERGAVAPAEFIPIAEETGLIVQLGNLVFSQACKAASTWPDDIRIAINVSAVQFKRVDLIVSIQQALAESGLAPSRLEIEITENVLIDDSAQVREVLQRLRDMGISVALDDFGTGYSGLGYLNNFPLDRIKIDRSFLAGAMVNEASRVLLRGMIKLSVNLGFHIVVEGVETEKHLDLVCQEFIGAEVQGFLFSAAMRSDEIGHFLRGAQKAA